MVACFSLACPLNLEISSFCPIFLAVEVFWANHVRNPNYCNYWESRTRPRNPHYHSPETMSQLMREGQNARVGHAFSTAGRGGNSGKILERTRDSLLELILELPSRMQLGFPKPYISNHVKLPKHFQNSLPLSTAGDASFFRSGSGEGPSELVMELPAVLRVFLRGGTHGWNFGGKLRKLRFKCRFLLETSSNRRATLIDFAV